MFYTQSAVRGPHSAVCVLPGGSTPIHYLYGYVPPKGVVNFEAPGLERGIHFRRGF